MAWLASVKNYLLALLQTQLALTVASMPILVHWGIGISFMTVVGNLLFPPLLTGFLFLSSLMFITELCAIPNAYIATIINHGSVWWEWLLEYGNASWMLHFARPHGFWLLLFPVVLFGGLLQRWCRSLAQRLLFMTALMFALAGICCLQQRSVFHDGHCRALANKLYAIPLAGKRKIIVVDEGFLSRKRSAGKAIDFEVNQQITKIFGHVDIAELRITRPTRASFEATERLAMHWKIDAVWLPYFRKKLDKRTWRAFFTMKRQLEEKNIRFVRM